MPAEKEGKAKKEKENQKKGTLGFFEEDISDTKTDYGTDLWLCLNLSIMVV